MLKPKIPHLKSEGLIKKNQKMNNLSTFTMTTTFTS